MARELVFSVEVKGFDELARKLKTLPREVAARVMRSAVRAGAKVIQENIRQRTPVETGALRDSIKVTTEQVVKNAEVQAIIFSDRKRAFYAHMVERGHKWVMKRGGRTLTGYKEAHPFFRPGVDASRAEVARVMRDELAKRLARELKRAFQG